MNEKTPSHALGNIEAIASLEREMLEKRTPPERIADVVGAFVGAIWFVLPQVLVLVAWIVTSLGLIPGVKPFDPFPFILLAVSVSVESVLQSLRTRRSTQPPDRSTFGERTHQNSADASGGPRSSRS